ncbi:hypothetical protein PSPO01_04188 [Paraphaeosphaeria sporulosa]
MLRGAVRDCVKRFVETRTHHPWPQDDVVSPPLHEFRPGIASCMCLVWVSIDLRRTLPNDRRSQQDRQYRHQTVLIPDKDRPILACKTSHASF